MTCEHCTPSATPEPEIGTRYYSANVLLWERRADGWHCRRTRCENCPTDWAEVCPCTLPNDVTQVPPRWTPDSVGCIFAGASTRTADELNACVVLLALGEGWTWTGETQADRLELRQLAENTDGWLEDHDESDALTEAAQDATTWLNGHIAPEGYYFTFDEGFYLYGEDEDF